MGVMVVMGPGVMVVMGPGVMVVMGVTGWQRLAHRPIMKADVQFGAV